MIPIDNSVAGRVADIHHLMPKSGLNIVAEWFLPVQHQLMAPKRRQPENDQDGREPRARARAVPQHHPHARRQGGGRRRHRGRRARSGGGRRRVTRRAGDEARGENLPPANPEKGRRRRQAQHHAFHRARAQAEMGEPQGAPRDDDVRVPGAQHSGRALQGDGRFRHQRHQHDQARKLHGRRQLRRHPVLRRRAGSSEGSRARTGARRAGIRLAAEDAAILGVYPAHRFRERFK
jgi:hypothetical protein